jgi:hypothetical protein
MVEGFVLKRLCPAFRECVCLRCRLHPMQAMRHE